MIYNIYYIKNKDMDIYMIYIYIYIYATSTIRRLTLPQRLLSRNIQIVRTVWTVTPHLFDIVSNLHDIHIYILVWGRLCQNVLTSKKFPLILQLHCVPLVPQIYQKILLSDLRWRTCFLSHAHFYRVKIDRFCLK